MHQIAPVLAKQEHQRIVSVGFPVASSLVERLCRGILHPAHRFSHDHLQGTGYLLLIVTPTQLTGITLALDVHSSSCTNAHQLPRDLADLPQMQVQIPLPSKPGYLFHSFQQQQPIALPPVIGINRHVADIGALLQSASCCLRENREA